MSIMSDKWLIEQHASESGQSIITPFVNDQVSESNGQKIISYGLSSYGYDMRLANEFKIFSQANVSFGGAKGETISCSTVVDPKRFSTEFIQDVKADTLIMAPHSFVLGRSVEHFKIPRNIMTVCLGKSTYARCGLIVNVTPFEPEWEGYVTIELSNTTDLPVKVYANEGIAQVLFFKGDQPCETSYKDRNGKYQNQVGIVLPRV